MFLSEQDELQRQISIKNHKFKPKTNIRSLFFKYYWDRKNPYQKYCESVTLDINNKIVTLEYFNQIKYYAELLIKKHRIKNS